MSCRPNNCNTQVFLLFKSIEKHPLFPFTEISSLTPVLLSCLLSCSGGKDSCYNMMQCVAAGHTIVALANLRPAQAGKCITCTFLPFLTKECLFSGPRKDMITYLLFLRWDWQLHVPNCGTSGHWPVCRGHGSATVQEDHRGLQPGDRKRIQPERRGRGRRPVPPTEAR